MFEPTRSTPCPNCGKMAHCTHSSRGKLVTDAGTYTSTLYGVCKDCAEAHSAYYTALNAADDARQAQQRGQSNGN